MKILSVIALILLLFFKSDDALGQKDTGQLYIGIGAGAFSTDYLFGGYNRFFLFMIPNQYSGTYFLNARYYPNKNYSISLVAAYDNELGDWNKYINDASPYGWQALPIGHFKRQAFTFASEINFFYSVDGTIQPYGSLGLGITYRNEVDQYDPDHFNKNYFNGINTLGSNLEVEKNRVGGNFYFSPIGITAGNKVKWFAEIGIGYKGIISSGILVKM